MYPNPYGQQQQQPGIGFQTQGNAPPYPPSTGYPPNPGYPPAPGQSPGYPPASGYPPAPGYPSATPGYPPAPGYPPQGAPGYPPQGSPGYPPQGAPGYPPQGAPGYPPQGAPGYPPQGAPGYPPQGSPSYPPQGAPGYPPQGSTGYPPAAAAPGYGAPGGGYPGQAAPQSAYPTQPYATASSAPQLGSAHPSSGSSVAMQQYQETPSIREGPIDATADAQILRKAMKGFGTDEAAIINILAKRTNNQRQQIAQAFKSGYGRDLTKDLKSELGGRFEDVVLAMMTPRYDYLAKRLNKAISGIGTKEMSLVDILCTSTNQEIREINNAYYRLFSKSLESDLTGDTSGRFKKLLVSVNTAGRSEDPCADPTIAANDAQALYQAGEKKMGTDESAFNLILATRSFAQIRLMLHEYERITGHSFEKAIKKEFSGDVETGLLAVVKSARNRAAYFAERLHDSLAGMGTKDEDLVFVVVTRSEIDMENIKQEYNTMYHRSLAQDISGDTSGDYKKVLLALIGN